MREILTSARRNSHTVWKSVGNSHNPRYIKAVIPFDEIDARLDALGLNRAWLAEKSGRSAGAIRAALAPNSIAKNRSELLQRALSETIEREEQSRQTRVILPERISIEASKAEFDAWCRAYKKSPHDTLEDWTVAALNDAAERFFEQQEQQRRDQVEKWNDDRRHLRVVGEEPKHWIDGRGGIAAGSPIDAVEWAPIPVSKTYPEDHYALRVFGQSMEPKIPDGSTIIVREFLNQGFPRKGTIVVYSDGSGSTLKEFGYRKAKAGEEDMANSMGDIPVLRSINKAFPEVQTLEGGRIDAVFVEVL